MNGTENYLDEDMVKALVCEKMHWTSRQYDEEPTSFINLLMLKWSIEAEHHNKQK